MGLLKPSTSEDSSSSSWAIFDRIIIIVRCVRITQLVFFVSVLLGFGCLLAFDGQVGTLWHPDIKDARLLKPSLEMSFTREFVLSRIEILQNQFPHGGAKVLK